MSRPEAFSGERVLKRAILRLETGCAKNFEFLGEEWRLEWHKEWHWECDDEAPYLYVIPSSRTYGMGARAVTPDADGVFQAINTMTVFSVLES